MHRYLPMLLIICFSWGQCDYNVDGRLDSLDIVDGVNCLLIDCFNGPQCDFNSDGNIDIFDIYATIDCIFIDCWNDENLFALHSSIILKEITGSTFTMGESESSYQGPPGGYDAYVHEVTLNSFQISETEITNMQYAHFLNGAFSSGLIEVQIETNPGPNMGDLLVFGSEEAPEAAFPPTAPAPPPPTNKPFSPIT